MDLHFGTSPINIGVWSLVTGSFHLAWVVVHCVVVAPFVSPFIIWWSLELVPSWLSWIVLLWTCVSKCTCAFAFTSRQHLSRSLILVHMITLWLSFLGTPRLFSKATAPFYIPTSGVCGSSCSTSSATFFYYLLYCSCCSGCEVG